MTRSSSILCGTLAAFCLGASAQGQTAPAPAQAAPKAHFYVRQYEVKGNAHLLTPMEFEKAVYPYLGPYRTSDDVEGARQALEKAYFEKGYRTVSVEIPAQSFKTGVIQLQVEKNPVGRLRVTGSRYYSLDEIRREALSLQEGSVPNFSQVNNDLVILNQSPDRSVTPSYQAGLIPGTTDFTLAVKDSPPWHGSVEINNRYSVDTTPLRINASASYDNLWQLEHSVGISFQIAPENPDDTTVFSGYYLAHIPNVDWLSLMLQGTKQDSNVNTLGGIGVTGNGEVVGIRALIALPFGEHFVQSLSLGFDYKHFINAENQIGGNDLSADNASLLSSPVTYFPLSAAYSATWTNKEYETALNASINFALRGLGSDDEVFQINRFGASGDFIYIRGDLSHTHELPGGFQFFAKAQGQAANEPLVNSEQFSGGGLGTVRGLLESEVLGDNGLLGTLELRTPSIGGFFGKWVDDWRLYIFADGGFLANDTPLTEAPYQYNLLSTGAGTRIKLGGHVNGSLDVGIPIIADTLNYHVPAGTYIQNPIRERPYDALLTFRVWADF